MINVTLQQTRTCDALRFQNRVRSTIDASAVYRLKKCLCINDVSFPQRKTTDLSKCVELLTLPCVIGTTIRLCRCTRVHARASSRVSRPWFGCPRHSRDGGRSSKGGGAVAWPFSVDFDVTPHQIAPSCPLCSVHVFLI